MGIESVNAGVALATWSTPLQALSKGNASHAGSTVSTRGGDGLKRGALRIGMWLLAFQLNPLMSPSRENRGSTSRRNLNELAELRKELEERARSFHAPVGLSFRFPPLSDSPEPPVEPSGDVNDILEQRTLSLRNQSANLPVIELEKWITTSIGRLSKFSSAKDTELRDAASDLHLDLGLQARTLRNLVRQEWYRQRELAVAQSSVAMLRKPVRSAEFDCCAFWFALPTANPLITHDSVIFSKEHNPQDVQSLNFVGLSTGGFLTGDMRTIDLGMFCRPPVAGTHHQLVQLFDIGQQARTRQKTHSVVLRRSLDSRYLWL